AGALRPRESGRGGLPGDLDADPGQQEALGAVGTLGLLPGQHVPRGVGGPDLQLEADELSRVHHRLPPRAAFLSRPAVATLGHGPTAPQRALGNAARSLPRAAVHAGRRPRLLPARPGPGGDHRDARTGARLVPAVQARAVLQAFDAPA